MVWILEPSMNEGNRLTARFWFPIENEHDHLAAKSWLTDLFDEETYEKVSCRVKNLLDSPDLQKS